MAVIGTDTQRLSNLVKYEQYPEFAHCRELVTYNGAAKSFAIGDLVADDGTVPATAADIFGVVMQDVTAAATTDTPVLVLARGAAGVSTAGLKLGLLAAADVKAKLLALNIKVITAI